MLKIIGLNHLISKEAIEGIIKDENPEVICLELCNFRATTILSEVAAEVTKNNSLLQKITDAINEKAEKAKLDYGSDQKTALRFASDNKIPYYLVDMPILKTQELFSKLPKTEQEGFVEELKNFESESIKKEVDENEVLITLKERYPIAFEFLVNMRNLYITKELLKVERDNKEKRILVLLGKGHVKQVEVMLR